MTGIDIQAKVKKGLARAIVKTGSSSADLVYKIERTSNGGDPTNPIPPTETPILLVDSIFKSYHDTQIDQTLIMSGDRQLVTNGDVLIEPNDVIRVGGDEYIVQPSVDVKNPAGVPLAYIAQLRPTGYSSSSFSLSAALTTGDAEPIIGTPESVGFFDVGGVLLGSLSPSIEIGGANINSIYTDRDLPSGFYRMYILGGSVIPGESDIDDIGDISVIANGMHRIFTYSIANKYYENVSLDSALFYHMLSSVGQPIGITIAGG